KESQLDPQLALLAELGNAKLLLAVECFEQALETGRVLASALRATRSFGHALATGKDPWSEASLGVSTTSVRIASWYSKPLIFPGQLCMAKSSNPAAAVASLSARFSHSCGINVSLASLGLCARTCKRYHGLFSPGSRPTASSQTLSAIPTGLRARWACGLMVLGTTKCLHETWGGRFSSASRSPWSLRRAKWSLRRAKWSLRRAKWPSGRIGLPMA